MRKEWMPVKWSQIKVGTLVKIEKDTEFPADILLLKSSRDNGVAMVDTLNLDGESNLKEKAAFPKIQELDEQQIQDFDGEIHCEMPNENLEKWDANI
jgi:P-type E1-E2 ATPase